MNVLSDLQTKKLGMFELMAMGFELYLRHFKSFVSLLFILIPFSVLILIAAAYPPTNIVTLIAFTLLYILYIFILIPIYSIAFAVSAEAHVMGRKPELGKKLSHITAQILPVVGLNIKFTIIFFLRLFLLVVPGIIYAVNNNYYLYAFILRGQKGKAAFRYSRELVKGNWWRVFGFMILIALASWGLPVLFNKGLTAVIPNAPTAVSIISNVLASFVSLGFGIGAFLLFLNLDFQKR